MAEAAKVLDMMFGPCALLLATAAEHPVAQRSFPLSLVAEHNFVRHWAKHKLTQALPH